MSDYERELREILSGNRSIIEKVTKSCSEEERRNYFKIMDSPFIVVRAAGSLGIADIVAVRGDISFLVEIKARKGKSILFSHEGGRMQRKAEEMLEKCEMAKVLPLFAFRIKNYHGDSWRVYSLRMDNLEGRAKIVNERIPKVGKTASGNYLLKWDEGMKLSDFIGYMSALMK
ncbi:MAG: Holliday junction resolvase [Thermoplasmata archaeon]|jgi:Holliday junction resolvase|nr:MAG: Holliday junction resolvase [Thermoplasmata archaeon]RLF64117.1 MAG: Holliday junction resolvase [Thermoplasmata archaeon]